MRHDEVGDDVVEERDDPDESKFIDKKCCYIKFLHKLLMKFNC